jgi:hypothetical protein
MARNSEKGFAARLEDIRHDIGAGKQTRAGADVVRGLRQNGNTTLGPLKGDELCSVVKS